MIGEEIWSVSMPRVRAFFRQQRDVTEEHTDCYHFRSCRIILTELESAGTGIWAASRFLLRIEGEGADVETIYHRYFIQFLSTGG